jgi:hypothetical protein
MSAITEYLDWRRGPAVGCVFARLMSHAPHAPSDHGQVVEEIAHDDPVAAATAIAARVQHLVLEPRVLAVSFVMPNIRTLEKLLAMALALPKDPTWHVDVTPLDPPPEMDLAVVKVVRDLPFGNGTLPSEALVLGSFDVFPNTRRAPHTALEIYVGEPAPQDPKEHKPSTKANLAHIDFRDRELINRDYTQTAVDTMWGKSSIGRLRSLGGANDNRAKAKVTFVVPKELAKKLGCLS